MSTRATIAYINPETEKFHTIYNHFDGSVDSLGQTLLSDYTDRDAVRNLIGSGDCRYPGDPYRGYDGEKWEDIKPIVSDSISEIPMNDYNYIYCADGTWRYFKGDDYYVVNVL